MKFTLFQQFKLLGLIIFCYDINANDPKFELIKREFRPTNEEVSK